MQSSSRRRVLSVLGTGVLGVAPGCAGDDGGTTKRDGAETTASTTAEPTTQTTPDATEPGTGSEGDDGSNDDGSLTDEERVDLAKTVAMELADAEFETVYDRFADPYDANVSSADLSQIWAQYAEPLGAYRGANVVDEGTENGLPFVLLRLTFERGALRFTVYFDGDALAGLLIRPPDASYEPPAYATPDAIEERSLTVPSTACDLDATLTLPADTTSADSLMGVVLVHGTGPSDRDQTVGPNKPFKDLTLGLASRGIAVLRYEKRTFACDVSRADGPDLDDLTVDDAVVALETLRAQPAVDSVVVAGHSQGGYAAPRIAARADPAGMVALASPAGSFASLIEYQVTYIADLDGARTDAERAQIERTETAADRVRSGDYGDDEMLLNFHSQFWQDVQAYDPPAAAADLDIPRFLTFGGRDWQVPVDRARPKWTAALDADDSVRFETYPDVNHLLIPGTGTPTQGEYVQQGNVSETLVDDLVTWLSSVS